MSPLELFCSGIATSEGFFAPGPNLPKNNHNPGDLRASPLQRLKDSHGFVVFQSDQEGIAALYHQVCLYAIRGMTPRQIITVYAPPVAADGGNNTEAYIANVAKWTGLDMNAPLWNALPLQNLNVKPTK